MIDFLSGQPQIKKTYEQDAPTPRLLMYREGADTAAETLFIAHVPTTMVKNILDEKKLVKSRYEDL